MDAKEQKEMFILHESLDLHEVITSDRNPAVGFCLGCKTLLIQKYVNNKRTWINGLADRKSISTLQYWINNLLTKLSDADKADLRTRILNNPHAARILVLSNNGDSKTFEAMANSTAAVTEYLRSSPGTTFTPEQKELLEQAAMRSPRTAFYYALNSHAIITPQMRDKLRIVASQSYLYALKFATHIDLYVEHPSTRSGVLKNPKTAYKYSVEVAKRPDDGLRTASCGDPYFAYMYARHVDKKPCDQTRTAACASPKYAYVYARYADRKATTETYTAASKQPAWKQAYENALGRSMLLNSVKFTVEKSGGITDDHQTDGSETGATGNVPF